MSVVMQLKGLPICQLSVNPIKILQNVFAILKKTEAAFYSLLHFGWKGSVWVGCKNNWMFNCIFSPPPPLFLSRSATTDCILWFSQWAISKFQNILLSNYEAKCKTVLVKMSFISVKVKNFFHISGFPVSLALKQRLEATLKLFIHASPIFENFPFFTKITNVRSWSPPNLLINCFSLIQFHWIFQFFASFNVFAAACQPTLISYTRNMYPAITLGKLNLAALKLSPVGRG